MTFENSLELLIHLGRLVTDPARRGDILPLVAEAAVTRVGARASVVLLIEGEQARIAASHGLVQPSPTWRVDADLVGEELERVLVDAFPEGHRAARTAVLVSGGELFGSIGVLFADERESQQARLELLAALADLTATSLVTAAQFERLERANAELRATKLAVARADKLRALGEMAAGVAHDLKNLLSPLALYLQLAQRQLRGKNEPELTESVDEMSAIVKRGAEMLERLRQFSRQSPDVSMSALELDAVAREAIGIAKPRMANRPHAMPTIVCELADPPAVLAQPGEVVSAVVNLIVNAIDAMVVAGRIFVRTGEERGGSFIEVEDTGPGMSEDVREHIFEPFFTTKGEAGTGLGLALVYACMVRHGGTAEVSSEPGRGARFRLWFPGPNAVGC